MGRILNFQTSNRCMVKISPFFQQMLWNRWLWKIRGFWENIEGLKVGKGSRDFASTTARKVVQIASVMHH